MPVLWEDKQNSQTFAQTHQKQREKNQINKITNEKGEITTDNAGVQRIIRVFWVTMAIKMHNLQEMDRS